MIDWDDAFDNSGYVKGSDKLQEIWGRNAKNARASLDSQLDIPYGPGPREKLDLFLPDDSPRGLVVLVHGGYWIRFDKSYSSHMAQGAVAQGWAVAVTSYPLAPDVRISEITDAVGRSISHAARLVDGPLRLIGHSAGGHLVSRMVSATSPLLDQLKLRLQKVVSVSGVHDLRPLLQTKLNDSLRLDPDEADRESPALLEPLLNIPITFWVGDQERPEFLRQTRLIAEAWELKNADVHSKYHPGQNHFSVIEALSQPGSPLTLELLRCLADLGNGVDEMI